MSAEYNYINADVFAFRLRTAMFMRRIKIGKLAENVGRTEAAVICWRYGKQIPNVDVLVAIADTLNVSLDYLTGRKESMEI